MSSAGTNLKIPMVGMGQIRVARGEEVVRALLGSCIGLAIYQPDLGIGVLAHIVLPDSEGRLGPPGKFADTAVPEMLSLLRQEGIGQSGLLAKMAGGAAMFGSGGPLKVGARNTAVVRELLKNAGIKLRAEHVGGSKGRRVTLEPRTGEFLVEVADESPIRL